MTECLLDGLRALAGLSSSHKLSFHLTQGRQRVDVRPVLDAEGNVCDVILWLAYDRCEGARLPGAAFAAIRPMSIVLRRATGADHAARHSGLVQGWPSGDLEFDQHVYVDSPTRDAAVLEAVLGAQVREAVRMLLELGFVQIAIDVDGEVRATIPAANLVRRGRSGEGRACLAVEAMVQIAARLPAVLATGGTHPAEPLERATRILGHVGIVGWLMNVSLVAVAMMAFAALSGGEELRWDRWDALLWLVGSIGGGALGGFGWAALVGQRARGRSDALALVRRARWQAFLGMSVIAFLLGLVVLMVRALTR